jgi:hypothetical protein
VVEQNCSISSGVPGSWLEPFVLRGEAALGGDVDEQQRLAGVVTELGVGTLKGMDGNVVKSHVPTLPATGYRPLGPS